MSKWLDNAVFYEIYPQSFKDTDADGIGNICGITEKLDYIRELGCNAIWINPCFKSPFGDAGYDVEDYLTVAPRYGTNKDLTDLFGEAHKRNMHVILDLVPGHTSVKHEWFRQSMKPEKNEYTDRYVWTDSIWTEPEGMGCIRGISDRDGSCAVNFFSHQPALNYGFYKPEKPWQQPMDSEGATATREAMKDVMRFWLSRGCDGFRVDMAGSLVKNDPEGLGTISLWQNIREFLDKEFPDAAIISEWGEPDKSLRGGFHMDFLLHFGPSHYNDLFRCDKPFFSSNEGGSVAEFIAKYKENHARSGGKGLICIPSGNHDMDRLSRRLSPEEMKIAFGFLLSMPGAPFIYYGDEIGMRYVENLTSVEGGYNRTGSRSPMQWDNSQNAGFSTALCDELYIPLDPSTDRPNVQNQISDDSSLINEVKRLIAVRMNTPQLQSNGDIEFISLNNNTLCYIRSGEILVIINPKSKEQTIGIGCSDGGKTIAEKIKIPDRDSNAEIEGCIYSYGGKAAIRSGTLVIPPRSCGFYRI